jgi:hypothetical protein
MCGDCGLHIEVTLSLDQWNEPAPECPQCAARTNQEFKPFAIGGSTRAKAVALAEDIAANDYGVADMQLDGRQGGRPKVRYQDRTAQTLRDAGVSTAGLEKAIRDTRGMAAQNPSQWGAVSSDTMQMAMALGRETRLKYGDGLDVLQKSLKDGTQPDLIEASKRRSARIW